MICISLWKTKELKSFAKRTKNKKKIKKGRKVWLVRAKWRHRKHRTQKKQENDKTKEIRKKKFADIYYSDINAILISTKL